VGGGEEGLRAALGRGRYIPEIHWGGEAKRSGGSAVTKGEGSKSNTHRREVPQAVKRGGRRKKKGIYALGRGG